MDPGHQIFKGNTGETKIFRMIKNLFPGKKRIPVKKENIVYYYIGNMVAQDNPVPSDSIGKRFQSVN
jgi:hypothetical protein